MNLQGKKALIVGASSGIGAAVAKRFAASGAEVCVTYNCNQDGAEGVAAQIRAASGSAHVLHVDASTEQGAIQGVQDGSDALCGLDILVNNAGTMFGRTPIIAAKPEIVEKVIDLNIGSILYACQKGAALMLEGGGGTIINTTSIAARTGGGQGVGIYGAAKSFVSTITRVLARELAPQGIRVNAVAPGAILTPFHERYSNDAHMEAARASIPMGRLGTPEDCAGAYVFLADEALSGYITGQVIEVNGGQLMP